jgi:hypothetical protein
MPEPDLAQQIGVRGTLPQSDPIDLAARYGRTAGAVPRSKPFTGEKAVGHTRSFDVLIINAAAIAGTSPPATRRIDAVLRAKSEHAYFYADTAIADETAELERAAAAFERTVWPVVTETFGLPDIPGVDGDPRIVVLHADLGGAVGGYHNGADVFPREARPYSNEAEMVYMDRSLRPGVAGFTVVLAHELQHLVHGRNDRGEEAWVNEGLSETALGLAGGAVSSIGAFEARPETQLNHWVSQGSAPHYGAGAAFFRYMADRFGDDPALGEMARQAPDGAAGVDAFLATRPQALAFRDVFGDWIVANVLNRAEGPYANPSRPVRAEVSASLADGDVVEAEAAQFGTDYYGLDSLGAGAYVLRFDGDPAVDVLPFQPGEGGVLWANAEDDIDTTLTREVDLTGTDDPVLTFRTWFNLEPWYDWGYVAVSTDGGARWRALDGEQTSGDDPVGVAFGAGYTGKSGGGNSPEWVDERIDLAEFAGRRILLRFEYVTDGSTHGEGWVIDNITLAGTAIPNGVGEGWTSAGWVHVDESLPQTYVVRLIATDPDGAAVVFDVPLDASQSGSLPFDSANLRDVVVAVAGTTEGTTNKAPYRLELRRP